MELCEFFELCPRFCCLQETHEGCSHYRLTNCKGICKQEEEVANYNERVKKAIANLQENKASYIIKEKGRTQDENAFILIEDGLLQGYGFVEDATSISNAIDLEPFIEKQQHSYHTGIILRSYVKKTKYLKLIELETIT
ncbi:MAG: DNA polymerase-3 subunit epsilon [Dokdonia sp.]|jgi:DNA polymerase-3 subunit epsilon